MSIESTGFEMGRASNNSSDSSWIERRESVEFARGLETLEKFRGITPCDKVIILSSALGIKRASQFHAQGSPQDYREVEQTLEDLGLKWNIHTDLSRAITENIYRNNQTCPIDAVRAYVVALDENALEAAYDAMPVRGRVINHKDFGVAMDFPDSSVEAFNRHMISDDSEELLSMEHPELTAEEKAFLFFRLSKDNWQQEIEWLEQIISGVREYSPSIYQEVIRRHQ